MVMVLLMVMTAMTVPTCFDLHALLLRKPLFHAVSEELSHSMGIAISFAVADRSSDCPHSTYLTCFSFLSFLYVHGAPYIFVRAFLLIPSANPKP
jgi:hypothetical protein